MYLVTKRVLARFRKVRGRARVDDLPPMPADKAEPAAIVGREAHHDLREDVWREVHRDLREDVRRQGPAACGALVHDDRLVAERRKSVCGSYGFQRVLKGCR
jgi:hypothetical protein